MTALIQFLGGLLETWLGIPVIETVTFTILITAAVAVAAWLVLWALLILVNQWAKQFNVIRYSNRFFKLVKKMTSLTVIFLACSYIARFVQSELLEKVILAVFIILLSNPIHGILRTLLDFFKSKVAGKTETKVDDIVIDILDKFAGVIIYVMAIIIALDSLGINIMPLIAGAGVAGIAVGFAAKDTLSNLIAGVLLLIDRPFEIGDRIEVWSAPAGSSTWGDVVDIGLRATKIRTTDNIDIIIPNNEIMTRDIVNYTASSESIRVRVNVGIAYNSDIAKAKRVIGEVAATVKMIQPEPAPIVVVKSFGESAVDLQLQVWIPDARRREEAISEITDRIKAAFDREGIEIPFPKRDITIIHKDPAGKTI